MKPFPAYWIAFAILVKQYWTKRPVFYTLIVMLGIAALTMMIVQFVSPWKWR